MKNNSIALIDSIREIATVEEQEEATPENLENEKQQALEAVTAFFHCNDQEARLYAHIINMGIDDQSFSEKGLLEACGLRYQQLPVVRRFLGKLLRKGCIKGEQDNSKQLFKSFKAMPHFVKAVIFENKRLLTRPSCANVSELVTQSYRLIRSFDPDLSDETSPLNDLLKLHRRNRKFQLVKWLDELALSPQELGLLYFSLYSTLNGSDEIELHRYMQWGIPDTRERYLFSSALKKGSLPVLQHGLIHFKVNPDLFESEIQVLPKLMERVFDNIELPNSSNPKYEGRNFIHIRAGCIQRQTLLFDDELHTQLQKLEQLLEEHTYASMQQSLKSKSIIPGITCLLHGKPGTGKTASVHQLGAITQRDILQVNISQVRSKWVGESEKNLSNIFKEYYKLREQSDRSPILLFNEADAILAKRLQVNNSADQMNNAMQNILLDELDRFDGILFATTNMVMQLDDAFERRFLYKLRFEQPGEQTRHRIWLSTFPEIDAAQLVNIASEFDLSPAQIQNLRKKVDIESIVTGSIHITTDMLRQMVRQEFLQPIVQKSSIGFKPMQKTV